MKESTHKQLSSKQISIAKNKQKQQPARVSEIEWATKML